MIIDFHIHSKYSFDCFLEPSQIIAMARKAGLDGIAVTDHDTMAGVAEFRRLAPDLYVIAGEEISTTQGDILGLFLKDELDPRGNAERVIAEIHSQGGLAVLAHPFKWPHLIREDSFLKKFDAIEVFNARNNIPLPYLENFLARAAVKKSALSFVAGSDTHQGREVGMSRTVFEFSASDADDARIKEAILRKRLRVEGREVPLPSEVVSHFSRLAKSLKKR